MAAKISPRTPDALRLTENPTDEWNMFKQMYKTYVVLTELDKKPKAYQQAVFLNLVGPVGVKIFNTLVFEHGEDKESVKTIQEKFDTYILGETNETYERYKFNTRTQQKEENIDQYVAALRTLAKTCNFGEALLDSLIRDRIVIGIKDDATRKLLLQERNLTLKTAIDLCRATEAATSQMKAMHTASEETVNKITPSRHKVKYRSSNPPSSSRPHSRPQSSVPMLDNCKFCGRSHLKKKEECPAWGQTCNKCKGRDHFSRRCPSNKNKTRRVHGVDVSSDSEVESIGSVVQVLSFSDVNSNTGLFAEMILKQGPMTFQLDNGATVNVLPQCYLPKDATLEPSSVLLRMYNHTHLKTLGKTRLVIKNPKNNRKYKLTFIVIAENNFTPLLGCNTIERMNLITVNYDNFKLAPSVCDTKSVSSQDSTPEFTEFADVFSGRLPGSFPQTVHLHLEEDSSPVQCMPRRVPVALKSKVKDALQELVDNDIITPVDQPTDWCSGMSVQSKANGDIRLCIDPRPLNKCLKRELYELPVLDDILPDLSGAPFKIFSKLDLRSGYLHCALDEDSSFLTCMITPFGRFRWRRLPFGLKVSSEIFQKRLAQALQGLPGVSCIADDVLVYGTGDTEQAATADHDDHLRKLLVRCREMQMKLNKGKCQIRVTSVPFVGHVLTNKGLEADKTKIEAVLNMPNPTTVQEVQSLQGTVGYLSRFLPNLSSVMEPIRSLTLKDTEWVWSSAQEEAMKEVKRLVTSAPVLAYYDPKKELTLQTDASKSGLGAVLTQEGRPIAYASRAMTTTEQRYAQIEKEALSIVFALERFHHYTFGRHTTVENDHKPLETIVKKPLHRAPRRLQNLLIRMLNYDTTLVWKPGHQVPIADMLSRSFPQCDSAEKTDETETVNMVEYLTMGDSRLAKIKEHTANDESLLQLKTVIQEGWPASKNEVPNLVTPYYNIRDELSIQDGLIFRGERVVIPTSLRQEIKQALHRSHVGVEATLRRARDCVYWPSMTTDIRELVQCCETCRAFDTAVNPKETLIPHDTPSRPWEKVGTDLLSWDGKDYLVTVCYFSNFWEIDRLNNTESKTVIKKLKGHFARYGIPTKLVSDNAKQFTSEEFNRFAQEWDFEHFTISPKHSQANGMVESAVKSAKRLLNKSKKAKTDPYLTLLELRNIPSQGIGSSPAQRLHSRRTRTYLPISNRLLLPRGSDILNAEKEKMKALKRKVSEHFNKRAKDLPELEEEDVVRMKPYKQGAKQWEKAIVRERLDQRSYLIETPHGLLRRNRIDLKKSMEQPPTPLADKQNMSSPQSPDNQPQTSFTPVKPMSPKVQMSPSGPSTRIEQKDTSVPMTTRSGRRVVAPKMLNL